MEGNIAFVSLGCDKNLVDSEVMLGLLRQAGLTIVNEEDTADLIVINTCCFIKDALEESIEAILEMAEYKKTGRCKGIIVAGCLGQRYEMELFEELPEVDAVVGAAAYEDIVEVAKKVLEGNSHFRHMDTIDRVMKEENGALRLLSTAGYFAYLKIAEGCDKHCTYCVIPKMRGKYRSRHIESLVEETKILAQQGVKELILVAQDTALYGVDLYGESRLHELLLALCQIEGIQWIKILYCYPEHITDKTIEVMKAEDKICNYLDIPLQHANDSILKRMGRNSTQELIRQKIGKLRQAMPDIAVRTTLIVGFPGETEKEFQDLVDFIEEMEFDRLGVFTYSQEEGTPAAEMENQIPEEIKEQRKDEIMKRQRAISERKCSQSVGSTMKVLIEGKIPEDSIYCGRSYKDAPDIDGLVFVSSEKELLSGDFVTVEITEAQEYDLIGEAVNGNESSE